MAPKQALRLQNGGNGHVQLKNYNSKAQVPLTMDQLRAAQHITAHILPFLERLGMDGANVQLNVDMVPTLEVMTTTGWQPIGQVQVGFQPRPVDQLEMNESSVRLQGGEHSERSITLLSSRSARTCCEARSASRPSWSIFSPTSAIRCRPGPSCL